jgi:HD-like signal output (HDOD) protein
MEEEIKNVEKWMAFLRSADIPVLKRTARELQALRDDPKQFSARHMAEVIARDPFMTVKLLRYLQQNKRKSQTSELIQVEQALIMLGLEVFLNKVPAEPFVETLLKGKLEPLTNLLHVVHRAQRASEYARDWAARRYDMHFEEVRIAALLRDLSEMLMWCFEPDKMMDIRNRQKADKALRSRATQVEVLGFALIDLQRALAKEWELPELLLMLMDEEQQTQPRVRNVALAVNLARHSANGWDDAALPDDFKDIGALLNMTPEQVQVLVEADVGLVCDVTRPHE